MPRDETLQLSGNLGMTPKRELRFRQPLLRRELQLLESPGVRREGLLAAQISEGISPPEGQRVLQERGGAGGVRP